MIGLIKITKQSRIIILLCLFYGFLSAQVNLVPNPSFEDSTGIPSNHSEFYKCNNWYTIFGSVDYFSKYSPTTVTLPTISVNIPKNCFGYQKAQSGNFYTGIYLRGGSPPNYPYFNYHECIGVKLIQKLLANHSYSFTMYVSLADGCAFASNQLQAMFSVNQFTANNNLYDTTTYLNYYPFQITTKGNFINDTANWVPIRGCFIANGGEEHLSIGNFKDAIHTSLVSNINLGYGCSAQLSTENASYIYIDDVSLYDMGLYTQALAKNDTLICTGTAINLSNNPLKDSSVVAWSPPTALSCTNCPNPIATPTTTTLYYLNKSICGANSKDSILVTVHTPTATINAGSDKNICPNEIVSLGTQDSTAFVNYNWQFIGNSSLSCTNCATPFANAQQSTEFILQRSECGITTSDTVKVNVDFCDIVIPNVFTPNGDNVNDVWKFKLPAGAKPGELNIFNRWGLLVYSINAEQFPASPLTSNNETKNFIMQWDGYTPSGISCSDGVYFYTLTYTDKKGEVINMKGFVSLFR